MLGRISAAGEMEPIFVIAPVAACCLEKWHRKRDGSWAVRHAESCEHFGAATRAIEEEEEREEQVVEQQLLAGGKDVSSASGGGEADDSAAAAAARLDIAASPTSCCGRLNHSLLKLAAWADDPCTRENKVLLSRFCGCRKSASSTGTGESIAPG